MQWWKCLVEATVASFGAKLAYMHNYTFNLKNSDLTNRLVFKVHSGPKVLGVWEVGGCQLVAAYVPACHTNYCPTHVLREHNVYLYKYEDMIYIVTYTQVYRYIYICTFYTRTRVSTFVALMITLWQHFDFSALTLCTAQAAMPQIQHSSLWVHRITQLLPTCICVE